MLEYYCSYQKYKFTPIAELKTSFILTSFDVMAYHKYVSTVPNSKYMSAPLITHVTQINPQKRNYAALGVDKFLSSL